MTPEPAKVLLVHGDLSVSRLVRESLEAFCECTVEVTASAVAGFERALQKEHRVYLFALNLEVLPGTLLYELIGTACLHAQPAKNLPPVFYFCDQAELSRQEPLLRDARVKGLISEPIHIGRLLEKMQGLLTMRSVI
jgi:CheY-like chemotaxis protein